MEISCIAVEIRCQRGAGHGADRLVAEGVATNLVPAPRQFGAALWRDQRTIGLHAPCKPSGDVECAEDAVSFEDGRAFEKSAIGHVVEGEGDERRRRAHRLRSAGEFPDEPVGDTVDDVAEFARDIRHEPRLS